MGKARKSNTHLRRRNQSTSILVGANLNPTVRKRAPVILIMFQVSVKLCIIHGVGQVEGVKAGEHRFHGLLKLGLCFVEGRQRRNSQEFVREVVDHHCPKIDKIRQQRMELVHRVEDLVTGVAIVGCQNGKLETTDNCVRVGLDSHGDDNAIISATSATIGGSICQYGAFSCVGFSPPIRDLLTSRPSRDQYSQFSRQ